MKKKLFICLLVGMMALAFPISVMAVETVAAKSVYESMEQEIVPFNEQIRLYFRNNGGVLQFRVWSITNGRWITEWTDV